jgi:hypothetical protein
MAASPDQSRLPPRRPGDLGTLENTSQHRQLEKKLSFFAFSTTNGRKKHLDALLIMYTKLYYKNNNKDTSPIVLVVRRRPHSLQVRGGVGCGTPPCLPPRVL